MAEVGHTQGGLAEIGHTWGGMAEIGHSMAEVGHTRVVWPYTKKNISKD